ncbi:MAG TPA: DUF2098 domain-containing protein [Methanocorpusculum sp.]|nr:DUF2098 domain-containing protein [Methanocorpusculum sp.]HJJ49308.1 DUF2098 domain-containing protein [Methanocorpusculum sp.]HJJ56648.1 DUF2098 domain-containing protein [Methanocorpusculum sp.]HJJ95217.1 DUF2098 domain-containing protein [Methanocorpusculum sp.]
MSSLKIGSTVRYSRTGTVGKIVSFTEIEGAEFAELDSTGLLYRIDQLIEISEEVRSVKTERSVKEETAEEQAKLQAMRESAWMNVDNSCEGGG